jgi:hypothetical protein
MAKFANFANIARIARKADKDLSTLSTLLYQAGVFGEEQTTIVDSLARQRTLELQRETKGPEETAGSLDGIAENEDRVDFDRFISHPKFGERDCTCVECVNVQ